MGNMMLSSLSQKSLRSQDLLAYYRYICEQPFTIVDVETTGCTVDYCRVIEVSVLTASLADGIRSQVTYLINPLVPVPGLITNLTGISQSMVDDAPLPCEVWPQCQNLLQTGVLTAHNLPFDYAFLQSEFAHLDISFSRPPSDRFCTLSLARLLLPELRSRSLPALVQNFNFDVGESHRAEADTLACWLLAKQLLRQIRNTADDDLLDMFAHQWISSDAAATLLGCCESEVGILMKQAGLPSKSYKRSGGRYRRGVVESLIYSG
jgi:DNA polymerase III subunit epsilon